MIGDAAQYQELVTLYGSYGDDELVELGRGMADLTEMAQEALKGELTRRGLKIAPAQEPAEARVLSEDDLTDMRTYAELAPPECIFDFESERAASDAYYALANAGIDAIVVSESRAKFDNARATRSGEAERCETGGGRSCRNPRPRNLRQRRKRLLRGSIYQSALLAVERRRCWNRLIR